jgi:WD40 repeat protein
MALAVVGQRPDSDAKNTRSDAAKASANPDSVAQNARSDAAKASANPDTDGDIHLLSGGRDNTVRVWDTRTHKCVIVLKGHADDVLALCAGTGGRFFSASADGTVRWIPDTLVL